jgi:hypothetical protein
MVSRCFVGRNNWRRVAFPARKCWLPVSLSRRTPRGPVLSIPLRLSVRVLKPKPTKIFRNPLLYARELRDRMLAEGISRAELARRLGVSRARVTQWLDLLELPEKVLREAEALGDNWNRQVVTERELRRSGRDQGGGTTASRP